MSGAEWALRRYACGDCPVPDPEGPVKAERLSNPASPGYLGNGLVRLPQQAAGLGHPKRSQAAVEGGAVGA